jgi:hypothetical protein
MRRKATATLKTMALCAAFAIWGTDCDPATCTSPVVGPGYDEDVETR